MGMHYGPVILGFGLFAALFFAREQIIEAIRRGPWGGGSPPPPVGPIGAADPFRRRLKNSQLPQ
jgi:hypothetical protein